MRETRNEKTRIYTFFTCTHKYIYMYICIFIYIYIYIYIYVCCWGAQHPKLATSHLRRPVEESIETKAHDEWVCPQQLCALGELRMCGSNNSSRAARQHQQSRASCPCTKRASSYSSSIGGRCDTTRHDRTGHDATPHDATRLDATRRATTRHGTTRYDTMFVSSSAGRYDATRRHSAA